MKLGIYPLEAVNNNLISIGSKALNLAKLIQNNILVPNGFVISFELFGDGQLTPSIISEIESLIKKEKLYAVRSSAMVEDCENESWAGQFESFLNIPYNEIIEKIVECHNSKKARAISYGLKNQDFGISVIVQEMVKADYAGVLFTKNPIIGRDEMVTEFIEGLGEDLVSGRKDPERIIIKK